MYKVVLTGGGTGGHIIPNLALVPHLQKKGCQLYYIGSDNPEKELAMQAGLSFYSIVSIKLDRTLFWKNFKIPFVLLKSINQAKKLLRTLQPDIIFSKGGYVSLPTCFAAKSLKIPIIIHESDTSLGLANKISSTFAELVITSFEQTKKGIFIGNPIRDEIFTGNKLNAIKKYQLNNQKPILLIMGGSSGSTAINEIIYKTLPELTKQFSIVHISGKYGNFNIKHEDYIQIEYSSSINDLYAMADIVVSRAGANALNELMALGKKTIAIPLPKASSRGDQMENALAHSKNKHLSILEQRFLTSQTLMEHIQQLMHLPTVIQKIPYYTVNSQIADKIIETINSKKVKK